MSLFSLFKKQKPSTAFSLDNHTIRWVTTLRTKEGVQITDHGSEFLEPTVLDHFEKIIDDAGFVRKLRSLNTITKGTPRFTSVNIVVPDYQTIVFHTHVTKEPPREMGDVITDHIKTYCEAHQLLHIAHYFCEYDIIQETEFGYDIHVTLVPKLYVEHLARLFKQAGISVQHIETAHHAVARSCINIETGTGYVLVALGNHETTVSLINGEHLVSHQTLSIGIENLYTIIERFLRTDREEATRILDRHGVSKTHPDNGLLSELHRELAPIYQSIDQQIITIGQIPYKVFGHRFSTDKILLYGEGAWVKGLVPFFKEEARLETKELDVWAGRHTERAPILNLPANETLTYAEALSLALLYLDMK